MRFDRKTRACLVGGVLVLLGLLRMIEPDYRLRGLSVVAVGLILGALVWLFPSKRWKD